MPGPIHEPGGVGVISRSGTLTYEVVYDLTENRPGAVHLRRHRRRPIVGTGFVESAGDVRAATTETEAIVLIGEIGGQEEEKAAEYIRDHVSKPVVAFISGRTAPPGKRMGHAGAIISGGKGDAPVA